MKKLYSENSINKHAMKTLNSNENIRNILQTSFAFIFTLQSSLNPKAKVRSKRIHSNNSV